jgi:cytochrome c553
MRGHWSYLGIAAWVVNIVVLGTATPASANDYVTILQGWSAQQKATWYTRSQGSRLIPLDWLRALEQPGTEQPFLDDSYIRKFRYLPNYSAATGHLPIGFAIDQQDDSGLSVTQLRWKASQSKNEKWVGMNCAACHTAEITYHGKRMRIEGGPTLADFQSFIEALNKALVETKNDPEKAKRFAAKVLGENENHEKLDRALSQLIEWQQKVEKANATSIRYGFGRLDAFGHIFNKVALVVEADNPTFNPSNAPVSYPFMWNVPQHDKVQWNGIVANKNIGSYDIGALARNVGEVTGVFADVKIRPPKYTAPSITSSADATSLSVLENQLTTLRPPLWPTAVLDKIDDKKRDLGREIFIQTVRSNGQKVTSCSTCHRSLPRNNLTLPIAAKMRPLKEIGTDIWMACNSVTREAKTGLFKSMLYTYVPTIVPSIFIPNSNRLYEERAALADLLRTTVIGTIFSERRSVIDDIKKTLNAPAPGGLGSTAEAPSALPADERPTREPADQDRRNQCLNGTDPLLAYKGRPLTGIWATAPYLHNGSVPTLYDLLLPPEQRPKKFLVGTREFDPKRVGFVTRDADGQLLDTPTEDNSFVFNTRSPVGRVIDGNSNAGHDYGNAWLTEDERWALVEYLKGL